MKNYSLGIDSGSTTTKGVLFDGKEIIKTMIIRTAARPKESIYRVYDELMADNVKYVVSTGYGRELLKLSDKTITEITCHSKGAAFLNSNISGIIDIGGQDSKIISLDNNLNILEFLMNDKCAAGTGRFVEVMMRILEEEIENLDRFVENKEPVDISSMCAVFAESEIISLLANDIERGRIAMGVIHSICRRIGNLTKKLNINGDIFLTGGLANSVVVKKALEYYTGNKITTNKLSQYAGAIGAAVIGYKKINI